MRKVMADLFLAFASLLVGIGLGMSGIVNIHGATVCVGVAGVLLTVAFWLIEFPARWKLCIGIGGTIFWPIAATCLIVWMIAQSGKKPDVRLAMTDAHSLTIELLNNAEDTAKEPEYKVGMWDLDGSLPNGYLQIPSRTIPYIRAGDNWGPYDLFSEPLVRSVVAPNHRYLGYAEVQCSNCALTRAYWMFLKYGERGWYGETKRTPWTHIGAIKDQINANPSFLDELIPPSQRIDVGLRARNEP